MTRTVHPQDMGVSDYAVCVADRAEANEEQVLQYALHKARMLSTARTGEPNSYSLLFHGARTRRKPLPHVHVVLADNPTMRKRRMFALALKAWTRSFIRLLRPVATALNAAIDAALLALVPHRHVRAQDGWWHNAANDLRGAWKRVGAHGEPPVAQLVRAWQGPTRHYHNERHLLAMLDRLQLLQQPQAVVDVVLLAVWFHDAIQVPLRPDDEYRSADWARRALHNAGAHDAAQQVQDLILATREHRSDGNWHAALLIDLDLAVLASNGPAYDAYVAEVRREHAVVPDTTWRAQRMRVVDRLLRSDIFHTPDFRARYETSARRNLQRERDALAGT